MRGWPGLDGQVRTAPRACGDGSCQCLTSSSATRSRGRRPHPLGGCCWRIPEPCRLDRGHLRGSRYMSPCSGTWGRIRQQHPVAGRGAGSRVEPELHLSTRDTGRIRLSGLRRRAPGPGHRAGAHDPGRSAAGGSAPSRRRDPHHDRAPRSKRPEEQADSPSRTPERPNARNAKSRHPDTTRPHGKPRSSKGISPGSRRRRGTRRRERTTPHRPRRDRPPPSPCRCALVGSRP
jgi:hypothetical protein